MARAFRRPDLSTAALVALVAASTLVHWLAGRQLDGLWILPDEAIYGLRGLDLYRHGSLPVLHGEGAGYGVLYPVVAGLPLSVGSLERGYHSLKLLQALVMSLAAAPVFFWGRRLMPARYALVASLLTVVSPLVLYSGFVMTETLFYPVAALALYAIARAVETATPRAQLLALLAIAAAVATRVQGLVLFVVFAAAIVLDALLARDSRRLRRFPFVWVVCALAVIGAVAAPTLLGSYAEVTRGSYPVVAALRLTLDHAAWIVLSTGVVPAAALLLLTVAALRGREHDPAVRAYLAVVLPATVLVVVQVGLFASRYAPHLLGRDLAGLPPALFLALPLWLARGAPRPRIVTAAVALALAGLVVAVSWASLVSADALPDTFSLALLFRLRAHDPATIVAVAAAVLLLGFALLPRAATPVLAVAVAALLVAGSLDAQKQVRAQVSFDQTHLVGEPRDWVDRATADPVAYVYDGERYWNGVWQTLFWNARVDDVVAIRGSRVPGPLPQTIAPVGPEGRLPVAARLAVASDAHAFVGTEVAHVVRDETRSGGLTLWRLDGAPRLSTIRSGVLANGDMTEPAHLLAYDCAGGRLDLTLLPKSTRVVTVSLDGRVVLRAPIAGKAFYNASVSVPPSSSPRVCRFTIDGQTLLGSTKIEFVRARRSS